MNVLFFLRSFEVGGVEKVTITLANKFAESGIGTFIVYSDPVSCLMIEQCSKSVKLERLDYKKIKNFFILRKYLKNNYINIVINQWGLQIYYTIYLYFASIGQKIRIFSVYHNRPGWNGLIAKVENKKSLSKHFRKIFYTGLLFLVRKIVSYSMFFSYIFSYKYILLSKAYIKDFKNCTRINNLKKIVVISNPITCRPAKMCYRKENNVIYVGRLDLEQKRVDRLIDVWDICYENVRDWQLNIIGDGPARYYLEAKVKDRKLSNVSFLGYKQPEYYYKTARIICLTSESEGFPLVLCEAMSFGVVPIVYNSFSSVFDIIINDEEGLIVDPVDNIFDLQSYSRKLLYLINNGMTLQNMSERCVKKAAIFSVGAIVDSWKKELGS
jgi:glycosyltransferase involved in cell wall biosynthesis